MGEDEPYRISITVEINVHHMSEIGRTLAFGPQRISAAAVRLARRDAIVADNASRFTKPCIKIAPVSTCWAIPTANPFLSHFNVSSSASTCQNASDQRLMLSQRSIIR